MNKVQLEYLQAVTEWDNYLKSLEGENAKQLTNEEYENVMVDRLMDTEENIIKWVASRAQELGRKELTVAKLESIALYNNTKFKELVLQL